MNLDRLGPQYAAQVEILRIELFGLIHLIDGAPSAKMKKEAWP